MNRRITLLQLFVASVAGATFAPIASAQPTTAVVFGSPQDGQSVAPGSTINWFIDVQTSTGTDNLGLASFFCTLRPDSTNLRVITLQPAASVFPGLSSFRPPEGVGNLSGLGGTIRVAGPNAGDLVQIGGALNTLGIGTAELGSSTTVPLSVAQAAPARVAAGSFVAPSTLGTYRVLLVDAESGVVSVRQNAPVPSTVVRAVITPSVPRPMISFTVTASCPADFNSDGGVSVQDIFDFLNAWFQGDPSADINGGGLGVQDIFDFLTLWFAGC